MLKKALVTLISMVVIVLGVVLMSAFESHAVNVTAHIENALRVHSSAYEFGTVFPQESFAPYTFAVETSDSFSATDQRRVLNIDYTVTRKPKPKDPADHQYCFDHRNDNPLPTDYYTRCYPSICPVVSGHPEYPPNDPNDTGFDSFTDPGTAIGKGSLHKKITLEDPIDDNKFDIWRLDLNVPCFEGQCAEDWTHPGFELSPDLNGQTFGCDLWVEVTDIH